GHRVGLLPEERYGEFCRRREGLSAFLRRLEETRVTPGHPVCGAVEEAGGGPVRTGITYAELLRRPEVSAAMLLACDGDLAAAGSGIARQAELAVKYEGYIRRQEEEAKKLKKYEEMQFPPGFPFESVYGLSTEVRDKLVRVRPGSIGQAQHIPGVTPAAVALLLVALKRAREKRRSTDVGQEGR
ncbi:MAG: tRNA uridine-5-carboxymethylaminomethyl(34) synthesis enzyme MnmG, partial [Deltaproteobacteria bacterium]|nr:tRNA uridine-5-carboxymethylaminomethyl(34) synthesis enzyme MnmG [Deltaproteobacteria bacterium]